MNRAPELKSSQQKKKENSVVGFRLDKANYTPFINRQPVKALRNR